MTIDILDAINSGIPPGWEIKQAHLESPSSLGGITPGHPDYDPVVTYCQLHITVMLKKVRPREITIVETEENNTIANGIYKLQEVGGLCLWHAPKIWKVKEPG